METKEEIEIKLGKQSDLIYVEPRMNVGRMFKKMFLGKDIFESGIIKQEEGKENEKV